MLADGSSLDVTKPAAFAPWGFGVLCPYQSVRSWDVMRALCSRAAVQVAVEAAGGGGGAGGRHGHHLVHRRVLLPLQGAAGPGVTRSLASKVLCRHPQQMPAGFFLEMRPTKWCLKLADG